MNAWKGILPHNCLSLIFKIPVRSKPLSRAMQHISIENLGKIPG